MESRSSRRLRLKIAGTSWPRLATKSNSVPVHCPRPAPRTTARQIIIGGGGVVTPRVRARPPVQRLGAPCGAPRRNVRKVAVAVRSTVFADDGTIFARRVGWTGADDPSRCGAPVRVRSTVRGRADGIHTRSTMRTIPGAGCAGGCRSTRAGRGQARSSASLCLAGPPAPVAAGGVCY